MIRPSIPLPARLSFSQELRRLRVRHRPALGSFLLGAVEWTESLSEPFEASVQLVARDPSLDPQDLLGEPFSVEIRRPDSGLRFLHGMVARARKLTWAVDHAVFEIVLVPHLWRLGLRKDHRIFQNRSTPEIVSEILEEAGIRSFRFALNETYPRRDYCVQYGETSLAFVSRLLEEEGIFYLFEHGPTEHVMVFADHGGAFRDCPHQETARLERSSGGNHPDDRILELHHEDELRPRAYAHADFNFEVPNESLFAQLGSGADEWYEYPGRFGDLDGGERLARIRLDRFIGTRHKLIGKSTCRTFVAGHAFRLIDETGEIPSERYVLERIRHRAAQWELLAEPDAGGLGQDYANEISCRRAEAPYRPPLRTEKPRIHGIQTAVVTGKKDEEIWTDKYGRIKVQFHWDRRGRRDESTSCWVRVSQAWAGNGFGAFFLPRIGQEVIVSFEEGDPDRPLVTGSVYNGAMKPPHPLPAKQVATTFRSNSSPGGGGLNEITMSDTKGKEGLFLKAQHDHQVQVGRDRSTSVGRHSTEQIGNDFSRTIGGDKQEEVTGNSTLVVSASASEKVAVAKVVEAGTSLVLTAGTSITLQCGASSIHMNQAGVIRISGTMITVAGSVAANVAAPITNVAGAAMLTKTGAVNLDLGGISVTAGAIQNHVQGGKVALDSGGDCTIKGATVKIN